ncbi:MAG: ATP-binding cassette domain-containing protein, partial [Solibacillus isronensis]
MTYLEVKNVTHHFFKEQQVATALEDVNFTVNSGEFVSFLGPSGCGKSTTGRMLMRLIDPTDGKVTFQDRELTSLSNSEMRKMRREIQ